MCTGVWLSLKGESARTIKSTPAQGSAVKTKTTKMKNAVNRYMLDRSVHQVRSQSMIAIDKLWPVEV
jgi:hypothetical protein